jgi:hypothetical protein
MSIFAAAHFGFEGHVSEIPAGTLCGRYRIASLTRYDTLY